MNARTEKKKKSQLREWTESIAWTLLLVLFIRNFIVQPFKIPTGSMEPTLYGVKKECPICHRSSFHFDDRVCNLDGARLTTARTGDRILVNKFIFGAKTPDRIPFTAILLPHLKLPALRAPRRGDIVVFHYPEDLKKDYVKRLVGLPGETLEIRDGKILINGTAAREPELNAISYRNLGRFGERGREISIPKAGDVLNLTERTFPLVRQLIRNEGHAIEFKEGRVYVDGAPRDQYTVAQNHYFVLGDNSENSQDSRFWGFVPERDLVGQVFFIYWPPKRWGIPA